MNTQKLKTRERLAQDAWQYLLNHRALSRRSRLHPSAGREGIRDKSTEAGSCEGPREDQ